MRGFHERVEVAEALRWIDAQARACESEPVSVDALGGRILAADVVAPIDVPAFDRAAMDGYAVRAEETVSASDYSPLAFRIVGQTLPGRPFVGAVGPQACVRAMTGAPMPPGLDAVVPVEYAREDAGWVEITAAGTPGKHVGRRGEDLRTGQTVLRAGRRLRPQDAGLIASLGLDRAVVCRQPRVRLIVTGNELLAPGAPGGPWTVYDANSAMLRALIARDGGQLEAHLRPGDDAGRIAQAMTAPGADVVLLSGGSSVGAQDHAPQLLAQAGELAVHGVAMRPSSPAGMGRIGTTLVFLLPGNPVSCLCAYDFFAGRAIRLLGGRDAAWPYRSVDASLARKIVSAIGRVDYCRVRLGEGGVEPLALSGASILSSTTLADGFVVVPAESEGFGPGSTVTVHLYG
jgi:molybdopterin molybdotransferase